jgi:HK97 family phage portal protein
MRATAVFACVQYLARSIAAMPLILYRRLPDGGKERGPEHPLFGVLHDLPNGWQTAFEFRAMLQAHLCLRGNAYARIVASNGNPVSALVPLHPDRVRPLPDRVRGRLVYEYYPRSGGREVLMQEEVLHLRGLSLAEDGLLGLSPLDCMREAVGLALAAESYGARFYRNDARPGVIIKHRTSIPGIDYPAEGVLESKLCWCRKCSSHRGTGRGNGCFYRWYDGRTGAVSGDT